jgi:hypothetical protein
MTKHKTFWVTDCTGGGEGDGGGDIPLVVPHRA